MSFLLSNLRLKCYKYICKNIVYTAEEVRMFLSVLPYAEQISRNGALLTSP